MTRILAQATKEWKQLRRDTLVLALAGVLPVVLMLLFGDAMSTTLENVRLVVEDLDQTPTSRAYVETYAAAAGQFVLAPRAAGTRAADALLDGTARVALLLPAHFERDLKRGSPFGRPGYPGVGGSSLRSSAPEPPGEPAPAGSPVQVQVLIDGTDANAATTLRNVARSLNQAFLDRHAPDSRAQLVRVQTRLWYNPGRSSRRFFGTGALGMVLILFPSLLGALAVSREHELGTLIQVYASTLSAPQWILGKALPCVAVGLVQLAVCFVLGVLLFEYQVPSDPTPLLAASVAYIAAGVLYGVMIGTTTGSQSAAIQAVQLGAFLISMLLSGFLVPVANIPPLLRWISMVLPARHFIDVVRDALLRDGGWSTAGSSIAALVALASFFFMMSYRRMRRMQLPY